MTPSAGGTCNTSAFISVTVKSGGSGFDYCHISIPAPCMRFVIDLRR